ncbi:hypothetical protein WCLP8_1160001 [uncultured Gammaproteobacteria bacterium]
MPRRIGTVEAYMAGKIRSVPVYDRERLGLGNRVFGPAVVREPNSGTQPPSGTHTLSVTQSPSGTHAPSATKPPSGTHAP